MAKTQSTIRLRSNPAGGVTVRGNTIANVAILTVGPALGHGVTVDSVMLQQARAEILRLGRVKVRLTHPDGEDVAHIVGFIENPRIEGGTLRGDLTILESAPQAAFVLELAATLPHQFGCSIEAQVAYEIVNGVRVARILSLSAVDIVGLPAANPNGLLAAKKEKTMNEEILALLRKLLNLDDIADEAQVLGALKSRTAPAQTADAPAGDGTTSTATMSAVDTAVRGERLRCSSIRGLVAGMKLPASFAETLIADGLNVAEAGVACVRRRQVEDAASTPTFLHGGGEFGGDDIRLGASAGDRRREHANGTRETLAAALLMHLGKTQLAEKQFGQQIALSARRLRCGSALDICRAATHLAGHELPQDNTSTIRLAFSTTSMPAAFGLAGDKLVAESYAEAPQTWRSWCGIKQAKNLRTHTAIRGYAANSNFERVGPTGEIKHASGAEETYTFKADTYAKMLSITREHIVNDDLGIVTEVFAEIGRQQPRAVADLVYSQLLANTGSFFGTSHSNYASGTDSALGFASLGSAITLLRKTKDAAGRPIGLTPKVLLVAPELESAANQLVASTSLSRADDQDQAPQGNPFLGKLAVEVEPRLSDGDFHDNASEHAWYLLAGPSTPALVVSFLDGKEMPIVETADAPFDQLGVQVRGYSDFGADYADYRGGILMLGESE